MASDNAEPQIDKGKTHDVIGPASHNTIRLQAFLDSVVAQQKQWKRHLTGVQDAVSGWTLPRSLKVVSRCAVDDLAQDTQQDLSDDGQLEDLKTWHYARLYAGSDEPDRLGKALNELRPRPSTRPNVRRATKSTEPNSAAASAAFEQPRPSTSTARSPADVEEDDQNGTLGQGDIEEIFSEITEQRQKLEQSELRALQPLQESHYYIRKTRQSDSQSLEYLRTALPIHVYHEFKDPLYLQEAMTVSNTNYTEPRVLVSVAFHSTSTRVAATSKKDSIPLLSRLQKIHFLESHTLADLRDALVTSAMAIPTEILQEQNSSCAAVATMDVDDEEAFDQSRYSTEPWKAEAVMVIDDYVYADSRYTSESALANLLTGLGRHQNQSPAHETRSPAQQPLHNQQSSEDDELRLLQEEDVEDIPVASEDDNDIQTGFGMAKGLESPESDSQTEGQEQNTGRGWQRSSPSHKTKPSYKLSDKSMHQTRLADLMLGVRLRRPCLLLHQGLSEHVFEFEEIRMLHPTDPAPAFKGHPVYPITTWLSRLPVFKCFICEKDPATRITLHDELAGVSPCYLCNVCFECLHNDEASALENGVQVIPLLDEFVPHGRGNEDEEGSDM